MTWNADAVQAARRLYAVWKAGEVSSRSVVQDLTALGYPDAWNLWLDVCDEQEPEAGKRVRKQKNPDGSKRRSRLLPAGETIMAEANEETANSETPKKRGRPPKDKTSNGNGAVVASSEPKKRGRQSKAQHPPIVMDLYLPRGRSVQIALPGDVAEDDMPVLQEQLDAFMALRKAQIKARG
jgi:hypothetical protein